jgi:hypothetical protein
MMATKNSGLDSSSLPMKMTSREVIEILDNKKEEAINKYVREEIMMKVESD